MSRGGRALHRHCKGRSKRGGGSGEDRGKKVKGGGRARGQGQSEVHWTQRYVFSENLGLGREVTPGRNVNGRNRGSGGREATPESIMRFHHERFWTAGHVWSTAWCGECASKLTSQELTVSPEATQSLQAGSEKGCKHTSSMGKWRTGEP